MKSTLRATIAVLSCFISSYCFASPPDPIHLRATLYDEYSNAEIRQKADSGDPVAMANLGSRYLFRDDPDPRRNNKEAMKWLLRAHEKGNIDASNSIGEIYLAGRGVPKNYPLALKWFQTSVDAGNFLAFNNVGFIYFQGLGVASDYKKAIEYLQQGANKGDMVAMNSLGILYMQEGAYKDLSKAFGLLQQSARNGHVRSQTMLKKVGMDW